MNSKDRKGVVARVWSRVQSLWLQPDGSTCQVCLLLTGATLLFSACFAILNANIWTGFLFFVPGLIITFLVKNAVWSEQKLSILRNVLLDMAFQECRCNPNAIFYDPRHPELPGQPLGKGYCHVCEARATLKEQFPGAMATEIRERLGEYRDDDGRWIVNNFTWLQHKTGWPIPKNLDLAAYLSPAELELHRADGQLPEAPEAKP